MICERLNTCEFMINLSSIMPFTAHMAKAVYCESMEYGCAKDHQHIIWPMDQVPSSTDMIGEMTALELKEIKLTETYIVRCVRSRETAPTFS